MQESAGVVATGLVKRFGPLTALGGIDLEIRRGEVFGLIGPNGAGKTTFIRAVVGALRPTAGNVAVLGLDPLDNRWELRRRIGYMPQQPALYPDLSARRNVAFFAAAHRRGNDGADVERTLELVELADRADDPVRTLSGGMQQRLSLACVLVHEPELLILDEPTGGVDPELRAAFWDYFHRLADAGATVIVSTHQMDEALQCERVALLRGGTVVANDDPAVLLRSNKATVHLWDGGTERTVELDDYPIELPELVGPDVDRVEIELEPLDEIILDLIDDEGAP
jgi:ABC-2 type transport system ATP-binding protein